MNHISLNQQQALFDLPSAFEARAGKLIEKFNISKSRQRLRNSTLLREMVDFVVEAEQTISEQKIRIEELKCLATTDELTGLLNRRGMEVELEHALANATRYKEESLLVYIDLDGFKEINDTHGHLAGDAVLRYVSDVIQQSVRQTDYAARPGGDEFAILFTRAEISGGRSRGEYIRKSLEQKTFMYGDIPLQIRASIGFATLHEGDTLEDALHKADEAMYRNKRLRSGKKAKLKEIYEVC